MHKIWSFLVATSASAMSADLLNAIGVKRLGFKRLGFQEVGVQEVGFKRIGVQVGCGSTKDGLQVGGAGFQACGGCCKLLRL
jgi:hypothetical protein